MKFSTTILFLLIAVSTASFCSAQENIQKTSADKYRAVHWGINDGLSQACVYHMRKDVNGFLWMGTQGALSRFDGNVFKNYYHDPKKSGSINAKNTAFGLVEDSLHNVWTGTNNGLYRYDIKADTFTRFMQGVPFLATRDEIFCGVLDGSIITYNIHSFVKKTIATLTPNDSVGTRLNIFSSFFDERSNSLWLLRSISDNDGWHGSGLLQISLTTGGKKYYNWNCYKNIPGHDHSAEGMCYDRKRNCLWINNAEGLMQFTLDDNQFHFTGALNSFFNARDYDRWVGISLDLQGRVWLATRPKGIVIYDPSDQSVTLPFADGSAMQKEISENNAILYCDRDGIIWSGFWLGKGLYQIIPFSPSFTHYTTDTSTNSFNIGTIINFQNAGQGKLWIGSTDGIHRIFDTRTGNFHTLSENDLPPDLRRTAILPLLIDTIAKKAYLFCFAKGLWALDMNTNKCQPFIFKNSANHEVIPGEGGYSLLKDGFVGCGIQDNRQSIFFVNGENMVVQEMFSFPVDPDNRFVLEMADDRFIFLRRSDETGKQNLTYTYRNNKWLQSSHPLDSIPWSHIIYNKKDQGYWVVAEKELTHYSKDFRIVRVYTPKDGLPEFDINTLLADAKGNIWLNTDRSIHQLNTETGVFSTLSEKDGFHPQNFGGAYLYMGTDGNLYLGGGTDDKGFVRISPDKYTSASSSVYLRSLEINQKPFALSTGVNNLEELSLRYFENKITLETGIIDYYAKGKSNIRYKLEAEGETADWQYAPANYTIRYEKLSPGKYRLVIQASNAANEFNGPEKILRLYISPPFWKTWWFRLFAILFVLALLYGYIQYRSRNLKERNLVLEKKVMHRTNELNNSLAELKITQDQLIQSEKMASLGELTSGIAHEIKNPLNFINNFSEINMELITEIEEEQIPNLDESHQAQMNSIIKTLKKNSEKINHHGKRVDGIVKGMLQHSRLGNTTKERVDINALCDESLNLAWHSFKAKEKTFDASFETRFDPDLPHVRVFPQDFGRVMINLINNAFYAVHEKKKQSQSESLPESLQTESIFNPLVIVSTQKNGNKIFITVSDNGMGIPSPIMSKIFQPFFTTKPTGEGTGLGLSMSYDIISKSHGGEIKAKSNEGLGTDLEIILPV